MESLNLVDYSRQAEIDGKLSLRDRQSPQIIVGCGGVGFWLGLFLAMHGFSKFVLFDADKLETTNLNRIPVPPTWCGLNKAVALRKVIMQLRPQARVIVYTSHVKEENVEFVSKIISSSGYSGRVWDCTDNAIDQSVLYRHLVNADLNSLYRKTGYEGLSVGTYKQYSIWYNAETYQPGYRTASACAMTSALAAVVGMLSEFLVVNKDVKIDFASLLGGINGDVSVDDEDDGTI